MDARSRSRRHFERGERAIADGPVADRNDVMDSRELKFVLKLLGAPDYRAPSADIKPNLRTKAAERDSICRELCDRGLVDCDDRVLRFRATPAGKALLALDVQRLPVSEDEVELLRAGRDASADVKDLDLPDDRAQAALARAVDRGFLKVEKTKIETVWLTQRGLEYLRDEFTPTGTALELSLDHLSEYLRFLRKFQQSPPTPAPPPFATPRSPQSPRSTARSTGDRAVRPANPAPPDRAAAASTQTVIPSRQPPSPDDIYELIAQLDREHATNNYLPIYHLRDRLAAVLDRDGLDRALYALQRQDRIELSSLQEAAHYTADQVAAGIPQDIGGPLFFAIRT